MVVEFLSGTRERILRELLKRYSRGRPAGPPKAHVRGATLRELSDDVALSPPSVLRHLNELVGQGLVERMEAPGGPSYRPRPFLGVIEVEPDWGQLRQWSTHVPPNWKFPLIGRVPDEPAQRVLHRLLPLAEDQGLLQPKHGPRGRTAAPTEEGGIVLVYGSCARGDARPTSDLDLMVIHGEGWGLREALKDLVAEANLWAERQIDLKVLSTKQYSDLPPETAQSIAAEAVVVYDWAPGHAGFVRHRIWGPP